MARKGLKIGAVLVGMSIALVCAIGVNAEAPMRSLTVEEGTTRIEKYEYFSQWALEDVALPESLEEIGFSAFDNCTSLEEIQLPAGLRVIENRGFAKCKSLTKLILPSTVDTIGNAAFYGCSSLKEITLPGIITKVENNLFYQCTSLSNIVLSDSITQIGQQSFYGCSSLKQLDLPPNLQKIEDGAFYECSNLQILKIPDSVSYIGEDAFYGCDALVIECAPGSYAEQYARQNGIKLCSTEEIVNKNPKEDANQTSEAQNEVEQVPETGVELPYMLCLLLAVSAGMILIYLKKTEKKYKVI